MAFRPPHACRGPKMLHLSYHVGLSLFDALRPVHALAPEELARATPPERTLRTKTTKRIPEKMKKYIQSTCTIFPANSSTRAAAIQPGPCLGLVEVTLFSKSLAWRFRFR